MVNRTFCCVKGCGNKGSSNTRVSFHHFPQMGKHFVSLENMVGFNEKIDRRLAWEKLLLKGRKATAFMKVCSKHFKPQDFHFHDRNKCKHILKLNAVPSLHLPEKKIQFNIGVYELSTSHVINLDDSEEKLPEQVELEYNEPQRTVVMMRKMSYPNDNNAEQIVDVKVEVKEEDDIDCNLSKSLMKEHELSEDFIKDDKTVIKQFVDEQNIWTRESFFKNCLNDIGEVHTDEGSHVCRSDVAEPAIKKEHEEEIPTYNCNKCDYTTDMKSHYTIHMSFAHRNIEKCPLCSYSSTERRRLMIHLDVVHAKKVTNSQTCPSCEFTTNTKKSLLEHIRLKHSLIQPLECSFCDFKTSSRRNLDTHVEDIHLKIWKSSKFNGMSETNTEDKTNSESCAETSATTFQINERSSIETTSTGLKNFKCHLCQYSAQDRPGIELHINNVHRIKRYNCHRCEFHTSWRTSLKIHLEKLHSVVEPLSCKFCDFTGTKQSVLRLHYSENHAKLFRCDKCDFTDRKKRNLINHVNIVHLKKKPFSCCECDFIAIEEQNLKAHICKVHGKGYDLRRKKKRSH